jgi:hypothetical protein
MVVVPEDNRPGPPDWCARSNDSTYIFYLVRSGVTPDVFGAGLSYGIPKLSQSGESYMAAPVLGRSSSLAAEGRFPPFVSERAIGSDDRAPESLTSE